MSYPQGPPGSPGYPPAQQQNPQFSAPTQQFSRQPEADSPAAEASSKLPVYLGAAVAVLGLLVYLSSYGPQFTVASEVFLTPVRIDIAVAASLLAALIAAVGALPKQTLHAGLIAVLSLLGFLLVISVVLTAPTGITIDWGLYLVVAFSAIQAIVAVGALLLDSGVISPPVPRPKYDQQSQYDPQAQYGQYPGAYYGQPTAPPPGQPQHTPQHQAPQSQRPGYPTPYGGSGYPSAGPSTGGFAPQAPSGQPGSSAQSGPPTPPTGFPTYGQPPASNAPTTQVPTQHQPSSSSQSDQSSS
ncbi:DUF5336 domain-containing protein [Mycolicibacterium sp.]|uniref:DUF5336 domain-containing protein n=1 Tax=Mycolicibacterium sp. TaxID=2320850 RepID=UPI003D12E984